MNSSETMRAVVLEAPGPVEALQVRDLPIPEPEPGWVPIDTTYDLDSIRDAHRRMEEGTASGKLVVVV